MTAPVRERLLRTDDNGAARLHVCLVDDSMWLSQAHMADLYGATRQNITQHVRAIYEVGEHDPEATCKPYSRVRRDGSRDVQRRIRHDQLAMIGMVGPGCRGDTLGLHPVSRDTIGSGFSASPAAPWPPPRATTSHGS